MTDSTPSEEFDLDENILPREREIKRRWAKETIGKLSLDLGHAYGIFDFGEGATWEALYEVREWRNRLEEVHWALIAAAGDDSIPDELMHP